MDTKHEPKWVRKPAQSPQSAHSCIQLPLLKGSLYAVVIKCKNTKLKT